MIKLIPMSEDFLYWDPESICQYPDVNGVEDNWFIKDDSTAARKTVRQLPGSGEVIYAF